MARLEKTLLHQINQRLSCYQMTGEVIWSSRLNSGKVKTYYGTYVKMCEKNTPDFIALIRGRNNEVLALFLEGKSSTGVLSEGQRDFQKKYGIKPGVFVITIRNIEELDNWINKNAKDFVSFLPSEL